MNYNIQHFNTYIDYDQNSAFALCHTNITSISKHIDELCLSLSIFKTKFHIIGITEHKITTDTDSIVDLEIEGFRPFIYDTTNTTHGGIGLFISEILNYKLRNDLKFNSPGEHESTFVQIIIPNKKNIII